MEREIKEFTTPSGNKITLKTYLTGSETQLVLDSEKVKKLKPVAVATDMPVSDALNFSIEVVKVIAVALNDQKENVLQSILDLPMSELNAIGNEAMAIWNSGFPATK